MFRVVNNFSAQHKSDQMCHQRHEMVCTQGCVCACVHVCVKTKTSLSKEVGNSVKK